MHRLCRRYRRDDWTTGRWSAHKTTDLQNRQKGGVRDVMSCVDPVRLGQLGNLSSITLRPLHDDCGAVAGAAATVGHVEEQGGREGQDELTHHIQEAAAGPYRTYSAGSASGRMAGRWQWVGLCCTAAIEMAVVQMLLPPMGRREGELVAGQLDTHVVREWLDQGMDSLAAGWAEHATFARSRAPDNPFLEARLKCMSDLLVGCPPCVPKGTPFV